MYMFCIVMGSMPIPERVLARAAFRVTGREGEGRERVPIMGKPPKELPPIPFCMAIIICIWLKSPPGNIMLLENPPFALAPLLS